MQQETFAEQGLEEAPLPGLTLSEYVLKDAREILPWNKAEVYMFGVAVDASATMRAIPYGQAQFDERPDINVVRRVGAGDRVNYMGRGLPLVVPPVQGFLAIRLLLAESDRDARAAAQVIQAVGEGVASSESITLLTAAGVPIAAAAAVVLGHTLEVAAKVMAANRDDVIEAFEGYFGPDDMVAGESIVVDNPGAQATFHFV
ncbi:MAG TPA: hypothetical protein VM307_14875 [Egibacteraceae bacterium]|nr:hypothetical protein [Egibacteraceae bacterium]